MLFQAAAAIELTGLTRSQLREWTGTGRRALIPPDVAPQGPGRHALYTWETLLALRVLRVLHEDFAAEVGRWAPSARALRQLLEGHSFPSLWGHLVWLPSNREVHLLRSPIEAEEAGIVLPIDPHLQALAVRLPTFRPEQPSLLPPMAVAR